MTSYPVVKMTKRLSSAEFEDELQKVEESRESSTSSDAMGDSGLRPQVLVKKENRNVFRSKQLVYAVLVLAAFGVCTASWYLLDKEQKDDFETHFHDFAQEILDTADAKAKIFLGKLGSLSDTQTSYSLDTNRAWPNTTLPNFDIRTTEQFETKAGAELYIFAPIVNRTEGSGFEAYAWENQGWIKEDLELRGLGKIKPGKIPRRIYSFSSDYEEEALSSNNYVPIWQISPVPTTADIILLDLYTHPSFQRMIDDCTIVKHTLLSEVVDRKFLSNSIQTLDRDSERDDFPRSYAIEPIFETFSDDPDLVGFIFAVIPWDTYFLDVLPPGTNGFIVRILDSCGTTFSFRLDGADVTYLGGQFDPNPKYLPLVQSREFAEFARFDGEVVNDFITHCSYQIEVHPADDLANSFLENREPVVYSSVILVVFIFTALVFVVYDFFVQQRQQKVLSTAQKTSAIVSSLFPKSVQKRIMASAAVEEKPSRWITFSGKDKLKSFLGNEGEESIDKSQHVTAVYKSKPIADFFPETTIMFADIVGFTAWSSTREPSQVFTLLETIYHTFDQTAKQRRVFKVETVGDCYVAVCGLPDPRKDHAITMARFARDCLFQLAALLETLEMLLGPDTADLGMRVGLHSGPVTAGVLRGERSRFQLFGDTMNTASRMESTGRRNMIQISHEVADHLISAGKSSWIMPREDHVFIKGKGEMQTYWLEMQGFKSEMPTGLESKEIRMSIMEDFGFSERSSIELDSQFLRKKKLSGKVLRLVNWNVDLLVGLLKDIVARRKATKTASDSDQLLWRLENEVLHRNDVLLAEVKEIITMPGYTKTFKNHHPDVEVPTKVVDQLKRYLEEIALMYHSNPFHNFEHASHVTMSVVKLFSRIIAPGTEEIGESSNNEKGLHDHTYGITSDPLTRLAVILSALVHDVDHRGVPNSQLIKEQTPLATTYKEKSVAEQNSIDLAWKLLMQEEFQDLRHLIYRTEAEFLRFRSLMVNTVLATDIMDKDLKQLRNSRWDKAFLENALTEDSEVDKVNRKATIVIEHLIQASDVAHTMQHWHIYRKWNTRLFEEMYLAYTEGRSEKNPIDFWYKGELGFLDHYVIPLAKKLKDCGVFGVSSDEYLQYALNNRSEWERKGQEVLRELLVVIEKSKENKILPEVGESSRQNNL